MASNPPRRGPPGAHFKRQIEAAEADGVARGSMTLKLSLNDVAALKRDRTLPVADLTFADGEMRYLGVRVEQGGVPESVLDRGA